MASRTAFQKWLSAQRKRNDPVGDLARDVFADPDKPNFSSLDEWRQSVGNFAIPALEEAWADFHRGEPAKLRPDVAEVAFRVFQEAVREKPKTLPPRERTERNPDAVKRGSKGGKKGGKARAESLSPDQRAAVAKVAATARWRKGPEA